MSVSLEEGGEGHFTLPFRFGVMASQHLAERLGLSLRLVTWVRPVGRLLGISSFTLAVFWDQSQCHVSCVIIHLTLRFGLNLKMAYRNQCPQPTPRRGPQEFITTHLKRDATLKGR